MFVSRREHIDILDGNIRDNSIPYAVNIAINTTS